MAISDVYTARSGSVTDTTAAATALVILSLYGTAAKRVWIVGVRVEIGQTAAAAGNSMLFQLARPFGTNTGTGLASGSAHDFSAAASIGQQATAWSTSPTIGTLLWDQQLPQTTGSAWEEFPPLGYEWGVPAVANANANAGVHLFVTNTVNTSTPVFGDLVWSE